jgi:hypothetical protein
MSNEAPNKAVRVAREVIMRDINQRTSRAAHVLLAGNVRSGYPIRLRCECANLHCDALIEVEFSIAAGERSSHQCFLVVPGHEDESLERIIGRFDTYLEVEKSVQVIEQMEEELSETLNSPDAISRISDGGIDRYYQDLLDDMLEDA